jgi:phosphoglycolate phosphatase
MKLRCLVFDFDGTLADTIDEALRILNELSGEYKFRTLDAAEVAAAKDMTAREFVRHLKIPRLKVPRLLAHGKRLLSSRVAELPLFPGMQKTVREARRECEILGILTSNSKENVDRFLQAHRLEIFDFVSTVPKLSGKHKNLKAMKRTFDVKPGEMLLVGDEIRDIKAARKADIPVCAVTWGFNSEKSLRAANPTHLVNHPAGLEELLQRLWKH